MAQKEEKKYLNSDIMEGMISIRSVIKGNELGINDRKITKILVDKERKKAREKELSYLKKISSDKGFVIEETNKETIDELSIGNTHGGLIAICTSRTYLDISKIAPIENGFYVILEGVEDPYNFGYCIRSLWSAGVDGIILEGRNWTGTSGIVCRASAGTSELMPLYVSSDFESTIKTFKNAKYKVYVADKNENSKSIYDVDLKKPLVLGIGGERRGNTKTVLDNADGIVSLEYGRDFSMALSATSAATVAAFEIYRQNRKK